jgi:hypothetical protein
MKKSPPYNSFCVLMDFRRGGIHFPEGTQKLLDWLGVEILLV